MLAVIGLHLPLNLACLWLGSGLGRRSGGFRIVALLAYLGLTWLVVTALPRLRCDPRVRHSPRERGYDVCTGGGYWLGDLPADVARCPECGRRRDAAPGTTGQEARP